jgi:hypothetical protein
MKHIKFKKIILLAGVLAAAGAHADDRFTVNGFGFEDYRQTNANTIDGADQRGTWENGILALVMSAKISDRDTAWAQLESKPTEPTEFTWAYLEHRFTDNVSVRIGRIKVPYGFYNEFVDNKALQLSAVVPSAYSFRADMVHDAYKGIGIDWTLGSLFTQIYGGNVYTPASNSAITDTFQDRRLIGGRITWNTPLDGLRFMVSGWDSQTEDNTLVPSTTIPPLGPIAKEYRAMLSAEYVSDRFDIKGEHNHHGTPTTSDGPGASTNAWYVQGGYKMGSWTPYARFDYFIGDQSMPSDPTSYQKDWVLGVNYKINENVNARIEDHVIHGYGLAVANQDMIDPTTSLPVTGQTNWNLVAAEVNFIF